MENILLFRQLLKSLDFLCAVHVAVRVVCVVGVLASLIFSDANESSKKQLEFEREVLLWHLAELERQAEHRRLLDLIEAIKPRRDLTLPAEFDEGY